MVRRGSCRIATIALTLALGAGCGGAPLPLAGRAGTTVGIAIGGDLLEGSRLGFGASAYTDLGLPDDPRGRLVFELDTSAVTGSKVLLEPRVVTRVVPDPATGVALDPDAYFLPFAGSAQVLALVDLPADAPAGTFDLRIRRVDRDGRALPGPSYRQQLEVLPNPGRVESFNALRAFHPGGSLDLVAEGLAAGLYPWPKVVLPLVPAHGVRVHAAHLVVAYPADRVESILRVYGDRRTDHGAIVQWRDDPDADPPRGRVAVDWVAPRPGAFEALAVVFRPREPFAGPVTPADFQVVESAFYDAEGRPTFASVGAAQIR
jgi:hypothetical protein